MAIDFSKASQAGGYADTLDFTKAVEVVPGEKINFEKDNPGIGAVRIELYWESDADGDIAAVMLREDGTLAANPLVFFNEKSAPGVTLNKDTRGEVDGDPSTPEETIFVDTSKLSADVGEVVLIASTYPADDAPDKKVLFGKLKDCKVLFINDETNEVLYGYELDEDFSKYTSVKLARFYKRNGEIKLENISEALGESLRGIDDIQTTYFA